MKGFLYQIIFYHVYTEVLFPAASCLYFDWFTGSAKNRTESAIIQIGFFLCSISSFLFKIFNINDK